MGLRIEEGGGGGGSAGKALKVCDGNKPRGSAGRVPRTKAINKALKQSRQEEERSVTAFLERLWH